MRLSWKTLKFVNGFGSACPGLRCYREHRKPLVYG